MLVGRLLWDLCDETVNVMVCVREKTSYASCVAMGYH